MTAPRKRYDLDVRHAADYLGLPLRTIYNLVARRELDHLRTSDTTIRRRLADGQVQTYQRAGRLRFAAEDLDAWLAAHRSPAKAATPVATLPASRPRPARCAEPDPLPLPAVRRFA